METNPPIIVAFGGGTNSTAMLCGFRERGITPSLICFADTGGELPHTYEHVAEMDAKCREWWGIGIEVVRTLHRGKPETLEEKCLRLKVLPSLAYGFKTCSQKFKLEPQHKRIAEFMEAGGHGEAVCAVGYDAGEGHRKTTHEGTKLRGGLILRSRFYLIEWQWRRQDCVAAITRHDITQPGKSSCWFCPSMKRPEILNLRDKRPDLYARGLTMESNLVVKGRVKGLYMGVPWSEVVAADDAQMKLMDWVDTNSPQSMPCGCYDG
jgi:hypothetical protein